MDGSGTEHSDSDSGESWILLEQEITPAHADEAPDVSEKSNLRNISDVDKDEDTDGISIISDSDHDSTPCEIFNENNLEQDNPSLAQTLQYISVNPLHSDNRHYDSLSNNDDFLGDTSGKMKTYVHKRNKRLSTVLNVIVLGSVITAAGIAIGHMWGVRDDCSMHSTPSVNKILSNLYKLQEENAYLRNKLKELSLYNNVHMQQQKLDSPYKHYRCKKVFEESLENKNAERITKCVDNHNKLFASHMIDTEYEKEFLSDIKKLKDVYKQNRSWLDEEISRRLKHEHATVKAMKAKHDKLKVSSKAINLEKQLDPSIEVVPELLETEEPALQPKENGFDTKQSTPEKKITYADSLKFDKEGKRTSKRETGAINSNTKEQQHKKKPVKDYDIASENSFADEELRKDDRYIGHKHKMQRKKQDRQNIHKKQKRKNKYEQWEMKGGYLKYYDDISTTSSQENLLNNPDKNVLSKEFELNNYMKQFSDANSNTESLGDVDFKGKSEKPKSKPNVRDKTEWYEKRAVLRNEARKKLEKELFGENNPNSAGWYFRYMQRREKCRGKGDNSTSRRQSKRNMNFKTRF